MSWIEKLHETYERCNGAPQFSADPLMPISHTVQQAHVEIVLDEGGNFLRAKCVPKEDTIVPATEQSAGRTGTKPPPHPLCDKIQYCASDYLLFGGDKESFYEEYIDLLQRWCESNHSHRKARAVLNYVKKGTVVADLVREGILFCDGKHKLITEWYEPKSTPEIFRLLALKNGRRDQGDAFVRWRVQIRDDPVTAVWEDTELGRAWMRFDASESPGHGLCMVTGETILLAKSHPKRLRHGADGAKLISSNDDSGFTFRGRFLDGDQACGVGFEITQKAHNALRWLIARQGYNDKASGQVFVAWAVGGHPIPDPLKNTGQLFLEQPQNSATDSAYAGDAGQYFALQLKKMIAGYGAKLGGSEEIVVMGLDSATPGRMAITFYRELTGSEFLARLLAWHHSQAWPQKFSKDARFTGAPAPRDIAEAAYGRSLDAKLRKVTVERLVPCIVDGRLVPRDLVQSTVRRACNRAGLKEWEWNKCLGIACGLFKGRQKEENYQMSLEEDRVSRDYLFGRLLAIADHLEQRALYLAGEERDSNAAKLMLRFADRPCSTWRVIELALSPYKSRLRSKRPGLLTRLEGLLDEVTGKFKENEFTNDSKLSGEFLLGFHCQRSALWQKDESNKGEAV